MTVLEPLVTRLIDQYSWLLIPLALFVFIVIFYDRLLRIGKDAIRAYSASKIAFVQFRCSHITELRSAQFDASRTSMVVPSLIYTDDEFVIRCVMCDKAFDSRRFKSAYRKKMGKIEKKGGWDDIEYSYIKGYPLPDVNFVEKPRD